MTVIEVMVGTVLLGLLVTAIIGLMEAFSGK